MIQFLKIRWVYHCIIWILIFGVFLGLGIFQSGGASGLLAEFKDTFFFILPIFPIVYASLWAKQNFFDKRKYLLFFLVFTANVIVGVLIYEYVDGLDGQMGNPRGQNVSNYIFVQLIAIGLQYFKRGIVNQYQLQELKAKKAITELDALKAQLNPHFLFNTLNNIYGINQLDAEKGSEMIMELSEVMRYHLAFSKEGTVSLGDEIQLLESYIKLEKLRLRETADVAVDFSQVDKELRVSPLLFLPFIENAFKHGTHPTKECFIKIVVNTKGRKVTLSVKNSVISERRVVKTNVGLQNTKRRLELMYPQKHQLSITNDGKEHVVELLLEL